MPCRKLYITNVQDSGDPHARYVEGLFARRADADLIRGSTTSRDWISLLVQDTCYRPKRRYLRASSCLHGSSPHCICLAYNSTTSNFCIAGLALPDWLVEQGREQRVVAHLSRSRIYGTFKTAKPEFRLQSGESLVSETQSTRFLDRVKLGT